MSRPSGGISIPVVSWAAKECQKQRSGELSVAWMIEGWLYARRYRNQPAKLRDVLALGTMVEPRWAQSGLRKVGVRVGIDIKMHSDLVPAALDQLLSAWAELPADEWYRQYEEIHPFADGNGRTGSILWNWHRGSLLTPEEPPDFWGPDYDPSLKPWLDAVPALMDRLSGGRL